ncbi:MAG: hypothetical protein ACI4LI_06360 [Candidatus Fimenecus sp.]
MVKLLKTVQSMENRFDKMMERFTFHHPYLSFFLMFVGMPVFLLAVISLGTVIISVPIAWVMDLL